RRWWARGACGGGAAVHLAVPPPSHHGSGPVPVSPNPHSVSFPLACQREPTWLIVSTPQRSSACAVPATGVAVAVNVPPPSATFIASTYATSPVAGELVFVNVNPP